MIKNEEKVILSDPEKSQTEQNVAQNADKSNTDDESLQQLLPVKQKSMDYDSER